MRLLMLSALPLMIPLIALGGQPVQPADARTVISLMAPDEANNVHVPAYSRQEVHLHVPLETFPFLYIASTDHRPLKGTIRARHSTASTYSENWELDGKRHRAGYRLSSLTTTALYGDDLVFLIETGDTAMSAAISFMAVTPEIYNGNLSLANGEPVALTYLIGPRPHVRATVPRRGNVTLTASGSDPVDLKVWYYAGQRKRKLGCTGTLQPGIPCTFSAPGTASGDEIHLAVEPNPDARATLTASW